MLLVRSYASRGPAEGATSIFRRPLEADDIEFLIGFLVAVAIGLVGMGGGTIMSPVLILFSGMAPGQAVGTTLLYASVVNLLVFMIYARRGQVKFRIGGWMLLGGLPGVVIGGLLLARLSTSHEGHRLLYGLLGTVIVFAAIINMYRLVRVGGTTDGHGKSRPKLLASLMFPVGVETGFSSAGSGVLGSLAMLGLTPLTAAEIVGTSVFFALCMTFVGSIIQVFAGNYDVAILVRLLVGGIAGSWIGATLALRIPSRPLKWALAIWLATLGVQLVWRGIA